MRLTQNFGRSLREVHEVPPTHGAYGLLRAGYAARHGRTLWALWPLGRRLLDHVASKWRLVWEGALTVHAPGMAMTFWAGNDPGDPVRKTLPPAWRDWLGVQISSYRDLPRTLLSWGEEAWGALRLAPAAEASPWAMPLDRFWDQLGLGPVWELQGAPGAWVWAWPHEHGPAEALTCACGYGALQPWAARTKPQPPEEAPQPLQAVATPGANTIRDLAVYLHISPSRTAKAVFLTDTADGTLIFAVVRGDMEVSLPKVRAALGCGPLRPATADEIRAVGAEPGFASPVGVKGARVVVDDLIPHAPNLVAGANRPDTHYTGVNYGRDFTAEVVADIVPAQAGDPCPRCGEPLQAHPVLPLAWGAVPRPDPEVGFRTQEGKTAPLVWAPLTLDLWALLVALAGTHRDEAGLAWPWDLAPWPVHLIALRGGEEAAEGVYVALQEAGIGVLFDDRKESPGVKFTDADLIGLPLRITVGKRSLERGGAEVRWRRTGAQQVVPLDEVVAVVQRALQEA